MWGDGFVYPDRIARHPHELQHVNFDYVVCANKSIPQQSRSIAESLRPVVRRDTTLVAVQNGVGVEGPLRSVYPSNTILSSVCYVSCLQAHGKISQVSKIKPHAFHIGVYGEGSTNMAEDQERLQHLVGLDSKFKAIDDINVERWNKMIFNGAWNPATAILGLDTHQVIKESPMGLTLVRKLASEISQVGLRNGVQPPKDLDAMIIGSAAAAPTIAPSMLQDARLRRQMEVESICGP
jgi:2-dehydropantoate 2-reductase